MQSMRFASLYASYRFCDFWIAGRSGCARATHAPSGAFRRETGGAPWLAGRSSPKMASGKPGVAGCGRFRRFEPGDGELGLGAQDLLAVAQCLVLLSRGREGDLGPALIEARHHGSGSRPGRAEREEHQQKDDAPGVEPCALAPERCAPVRRPAAGAARLSPKRRSVCRKHALPNRGCRPGTHGLLAKELHGGGTLHRLCQALVRSQPPRIQAPSGMPRVFTGRRWQPWTAAGSRRQPVVSPLGALC